MIKKLFFILLLLYLPFGLADAITGAVNYSAISINTSINFDLSNSSINYTSTSITDYSIYFEEIYITEGSEYIQYNINITESDKLYSYNDNQKDLPHINASTSTVTRIKSNMDNDATSVILTKIATCSELFDVGCDSCSILSYSCNSDIATIMIGSIAKGQADVTILQEATEEQNEACLRVTGTFYDALVLAAIIGLVLVVSMIVIIWQGGVNVDILTGTIVTVIILAVFILVGIILAANITGTLCF